MEMLRIAEFSAAKLPANDVKLDGRNFDPAFTRQGSAEEEREMSQKIEKICHWWLRASETDSQKAVLYIFYRMEHTLSKTVVFQIIGAYALRYG
jgi:hypothetical protein